jgi:chromosome segregation and condensation protein ScpB
MRKQLKTKIRAALTAAGKPLPPDALIRRVKGAPPEQVREAIWSMLSQRLLTVTADWKLKSRSARRSR